MMRFRIRRLPLTTTLASTALLATMLLATSGCSKVFGQAPTRAFGLRLRVTSDDESPVTGAQISVTGSTSVVTDSQGEAALRVSGHEGERLSVIVRCPNDFQSPLQPLSISLHQSGDASRPFVYTATCVPLRRTAIVAVRMDGGPNLPVLFLDEEVARTDASGAAHFRVKVAPGEPFRVSVQTEDEELRPQNPSAELSLGSTDEILLFDQKLTRLKKQVFVPRGKPRRPTRL